MGEFRVAQNPGFGNVALWSTEGKVRDMSSSTFYQCKERKSASVWNESQMTNVNVQVQCTFFALKLLSPTRKTKNSQMRKTVSQKNNFFMFGANFTWRNNFCELWGTRALDNYKIVGVPDKNPASASYQKPVEVPKCWIQAYSPSIGCGYSEQRKAITYKNFYICLSNLALVWHDVWCYRLIIAVFSGF